MQKIRISAAMTACPGRKGISGVRWADRQPDSSRTKQTAHKRSRSKPDFWWAIPASVNREKEKGECAGDEAMKQDASRDHRYSARKRRFAKKTARDELENFLRIFSARHHARYDCGQSIESASQRDGPRYSRDGRGRR